MNNCSNCGGVKEKQIEKMEVCKIVWGVLLSIGIHTITWGIYIATMEKNRMKNCV